MDETTWKHSTPEGPNLYLNVVCVCCLTDDVGRFLLFSFKKLHFLLGYSFMHCVQRTYRALIITISYRAVTIGTPRHTPDPPTATYAAKLFLVKLLFKFWISRLYKWFFSFNQASHRTDWVAKSANSNRTKDAPSKPLITASGRRWPASARTSSKMTKE